MQQPCYKSNLWPRKSKWISAMKKLVPCKNSSYQIGFKESIWGLINVYVCVCRMKIFHLVTLTRCSASQQMSSELQRLWPTYGTNPCPINCLRNCDGLPNLCQILTSAHKCSHIHSFPFAEESIGGISITLQSLIINNRLEKGVLSKNTNLLSHQTNTECLHKLQLSFHVLF